jgi:hypothetical protein
MEQINWKEVAQQYFDDNGSNDNWVFEVVDSYVPIHYYDIAQEAIRLNLLTENVEQMWVGSPIYQAFQMLIFTEYHSLFMEEYNKILEEEE